MMSDLEAAKVAKPGSPTSYNNHAYLLVEEGDYAAALPLIEKSFALGGDDVEFYDTYGHVLMGLGRVAVAEEAFAKAIRSEEHTAELQVLMRSVYAVFGL